MSHPANDLLERTETTDTWSAAMPEAPTTLWPPTLLGLAPVAAIWSAILVPVAMSPFGFGPTILTGLLSAGILSFVERRRRLRNATLLSAILETTRGLDPSPIDPFGAGDLQDFIREWNRNWPAICATTRRMQGVSDGIRELPVRLESTLRSIEDSTNSQEEAVEETASLVANMRQSMRTIDERIGTLLQSSDESSSAALQMNQSIEEVAGSTATLHEVVEASASSVHEMGASIRQVAEGAEQVQAMAESTAAAVIQMDRSVQEVSSNAVEASSLTEKAHAGASMGTDAVRATIKDIEQISTLTHHAKDQLGGLLARVSRIGNVLSAINEINDETKLLSLNAAIIAAQAGESGKAFLVVANHVKTLSLRTTASTRDIEELIASIEVEASDTVQAMEAGITAVATGMDRSRDAGEALATIQTACREASERVGEIARATTEQSRNSKGVAQATQTTSTQIQQMALAITEQRRASESMLENAERALDSCRHVHRSTDEQRLTSRHISNAVSEITAMISAIGEQTTVHARASESVSESVMHLLENARLSGSEIEPIRLWVAQLAERAESEEEFDSSAEIDVDSDIDSPDRATASPAR